ncbi:uncharacterized protein LOC133887777 [Phragmites australis]|uniref:uncharacterized protein LOC133887777 n=1 Tax=Phragmites australis TaxID=29695 RepID=UPI002D772A51|nr:uncharacterized protein LOC133887777 [Phragmites australis]
MQSIKISDLNHMVHLEELYVESCYDLNTLVADAEQTPSCLQFLTISVLPALENVIVAPMPHRFRYIRKLVILRCPKLQNITWVEVLERLVISHCDEMLKIVEEDHIDDDEEQGGAMTENSWNEWNNDGQSMCKSKLTNGTIHTDFPKLRSIVLTDVKKLRSICNPRDFPSLETIRVEDCPNLRSISLNST